MHVIARSRGSTAKYRQPGRAIFKQAPLLSGCSRERTDPLSDRRRLRCICDETAGGKEQRNAGQGDRQRHHQGHRRLKSNRAKRVGHFTGASQKRQSNREIATSNSLAAGEISRQFQLLRGFGCAEAMNGKNGTRVSRWAAPRMTET